VVRKTHNKAKALPRRRLYPVNPTKPARFGCPAIRVLRITHHPLQEKEGWNVHYIHLRVSVLPIVFSHIIHGQKSMMLIQIHFKE